MIIQRGQPLANDHPVSHTFLEQFVLVLYRVSREGGGHGCTSSEDCAVPTFLHFSHCAALTHVSSPFSLLLSRFRGHESLRRGSKASWHSFTEENILSRVLSGRTEPRTWSMGLIQSLFKIQNPDKGQHLDLDLTLREGIPEKNPFYCTAYSQWFSCDIKHCVE